MNEHIEKPVLWVGSAKNDLMEMPDNVKKDFGYALHQVQNGEFPDVGKVLKGFKGASVIELVTDHDGNAFRAVYTLRFKDAIVVLHAFQKKSKRGIETPKQEIDKVHSRFALAEIIYREWKGKQEK